MDFQASGARRCGEAGGSRSSGPDAPTGAVRAADHVDSERLATVPTQVSNVAQAQPTCGPQPQPANHAALAQTQPTHEPQPQPANGAAFAQTQLTGGPQPQPANHTATAGAEPQPTDATQEEYLELASALMQRGCELAKFRPRHDVSAATRGLPAVMRALAQAQGPLSPGELARLTNVTDARIANVLRVLEERGLVERHASSKDRRRVEVSLTQAGRDETEQRAQEAVNFVADFLSELGCEDARDFVRILGRVVEVMEARRARGIVPPDEPKGE